MIDELFSLRWKKQQQTNERMKKQTNKQMMMIRMMRIDDIRTNKT